MAKSEAKVDELIGKIERGELQLPEMQRRYVWRATRVRDLFDSLYRGYPSGAILIWESGADVPTRKFAVEQESSPYRAVQLLLDGQQRLTSLSAILRGHQIEVRGRKRPIDLLFNLEHPEKLTLVTEVNEDSDEDDFDEDTSDANDEDVSSRFEQMTFVVATKSLTRLPHWISVSEVFAKDSDTDFLKEAGVVGFDDPKYDKYTKRLKQLRSIRNYSYRMDILDRNLSYEEVTEIFVRVNSLGAKLRGSDLALAQITAKWENSLKEFQEFQSDCTDAGFELDLGIQIRNLIVFATGQSRFRTVSSLNLKQLQDGWERGKEAFRFAMNFLKSNAQIDSPALMSSPYLIIAVGYIGDRFGFKLKPAQEKLLRYWLYLVNTKGRYSRGSSETFLAQDLAIIRNAGDVEALVDAVRNQFGSLEIAPSDLEGRNQRSAYFKMMFVAFRAAGAKDWNSNLLVSLSHKGQQHKLQFHHIFPKAYLANSYKAREVNDIANLAFIGGKSNRKISNKSPKTYLPKLIEQQGTKPFTSQCIPVSEGLLESEAYPEFLAERRRLIAKRLNKFISNARDK